MQSCQTNKQKNKNMNDKKREMNAMQQTIKQKNTQRGDEWAIPPCLKRVNRVFLFFIALPYFVDLYTPGMYMILFIHSDPL